MVTVQLCLAFAALVAHVPSSQWGQGGAVQWLMKKLENQSPEKSVPIMLEMLTVLPEVCRPLSTRCHHYQFVGVVIFKLLVSRIV